MHQVLGCSYRGREWVDILADVEWIESILLRIGHLLQYLPVTV